MKIPVHTLFDADCTSRPMTRRSAILVAVRAAGVISVTLAGCPGSTGGSARQSPPAPPAPRQPVTDSDRGPSSDVAGS
jgi:hypothetical protein